MKKYTRIIVIAGICAGLSACEQKKKSTISETETEIVQPSTPTADTVTEDVQPPAELRTVEGKVVAINQGKDGYTAEIKNAAGETYFVTISHSNLDNHTQYKTVKLGDKLRVSGDFWKMEDENQITVRVIL